MTICRGSRIIARRWRRTKRGLVWAWQLRRGCCKTYVSKKPGQNVSNPDSFIEEVSEEVRRDRLYRLFRKYAWVGVLLVVGVVGGTAVNEWMKSQAIAKGQAFGDAVQGALDQDSPAARREALAAVATEGDQAALLALLLSSDPTEDKAGSMAALDGVIADGALSPVYHDLAVLRRAILAGADTPFADRRSALEGISAAGQPYRVLALEQLAYLLIEEGKGEDAIIALRALTVDQEASANLRSRVATVIITLGGTIELVEPTPSGG